jgi:signal transduction histidine kinase
MKSFRTFMAEQQDLDEAVVRKGAVAAYALQGRKNGNNAVRSYNKAKQTLKTSVNSTNLDQKADKLLSAIMHLLDGLVATRKQIGSVSSQVTSSTVI